jgi:voltage-gated potassium channel Kch
MPSGPQPFTLRASGLWLRILIFVAVLATGFVALLAGTGFSERDMPAVDVATKLYYTLGLFVFGGLDLGVPDGGPEWARVLLWLTYFAAPAITTSALIEGLLLVVKPDSWRLRWLRGHVIIGGCGRLTLLYIHRLRQRHPGRPVLLIERHAENPHIQMLSEGAATQVLIGDVASEAVLQALQLHRARSVLLLTGDDYANLDAASRICRLRPELASRILVHVSDIRLLRVLEHSRILGRISKFNSYRSAARHVVEATLLPHFHLTERLDTVVLAGFGRFGQTVLDELQQQASGLFQTMVIIDLNAEQLALVFDEQLGFSGDYRREVLEADLRHPRTWQQVRAIIGKPGPRPVFVLGSGADGVNIRTALWLSSTYPDAKIVARCFDKSSFTEQISRECGFEIVSTAEMLLASMGPDWLGADPDGLAVAASEPEAG